LRGTLLRRYQRFFVDVRLRNRHVVTAHTPNTGSMLGCSDPGSPVYLSRARPGRRRLRYTLEIVDAGSALVGVNTLVPNRLIREAVRRDQIPELAGYRRLRPEVRVGQGSRIDLLLEDDARACYVEIKNVTLADGGVARFPDAVTERGQRHLRELRRLAAAGARAVILFVVQRVDCTRMAPADAIDPEYGRLLRRVVEEGVEALAYRAVVTPELVQLDRRLPLELQPG
jgi:sugar fermentation stimulation protein A